jgi:ribonuclease P protein subunit RPR2
MYGQKRRASVRRKVRRVALERICILFGRAREVFDYEPVLAQRYVDLARRVGMRYKVRIPPEFRVMVCRHCKGFILPGMNCTVRIRQEREPHVVVTCLRCGGRMRMPLKRKARSGVVPEA